MNFKTVIAVSILVSTSACTFSKGPINDFVVAPEGSDGGIVSDTPSDAVDAVPEAPTAGNDEVITPTTPATPGGDTGGNNGNDTPEPVTPTPQTPDEEISCHRIAYVSSGDVFDDRVFVATDCVGDQPKETSNDVVFVGGTNLSHATPTFAADGDALTTYLLSWTGADIDSLLSFQSSFVLDTDETGTPALKDTVGGDRDGDGDLDVARFLAAQNPIDALGQLSITAPGPVCGNGVVDGFETCDDGNQDDADLCSNNCRPVGGLVATPQEPVFVKSLVYTKKALASGLSVKKTILASEPTLGNAGFTRENSVIFSARLNGATDSNVYAFDLENGSAPTKISGLSEDGVNERQASVSPDGIQIVYARGFEIMTCDLIVARLLPANIKTYSCVNHTKVSKGPFDGVKNVSPCYSHDARYVFFVSNVAHGANGAEHDSEVWRVKTDGSSPVNVTDNGNTERSLTCSPAAGPTGILK